MTLDVVERTADRAGAALNAVAGADQVLLLLLIPLVDPRRAEMVAVLADALGGADRLIDDLYVRAPRVLVEFDCEELVRQLFHRLSRSKFLSEVLLIFKC